ncbi:MAG: hypothetical protein SFU56_10535 [Capsulimonadales bacterium]|nr:hypothetical protein [Capsulimonadales bacterium]
MRMFLRRTPWFALAFALTVPVFAPPVRAQVDVSPRDRSYDARDRDYRDYRDRDEVRGVWSLTRSISGYGEGEIRYRLVLREDGRAVLEAERSGRYRRDRRTDDDFGSLLYVYLERDRRVTHTGTWSGDGNALTIQLSDIAGRRDNARFTGRIEERRLRLSTNNPGMYGKDGPFSFRRDGFGNGPWYPDRRDNGGAPRDRWDRLDRDGWDRDGWNRDRWDRDRRDRDRWDRDDDRPRNDRDSRFDRENGLVRWSGSVDQGVVLYVRGANIQAESTGGRPIVDMRSSFRRSLPSRPVRVSLVGTEGRGRIQLVEQPSARNGYTAVIRISDPEAGRGDYRFSLNWD